MNLKTIVLIISIMALASPLLAITASSVSDAHAAGPRFVQGAIVLHGQRILYFEDRAARTVCYKTANGDDTGWSCAPSIFIER